MTVSHPAETVTLHHGDALTALRDLPDESVHAIITDPPYGLADHRPEVVAQAITAWATGDRERVPTGRGFMGRSWDAFVPPPAVWDECLRVLKPGGHMAVFAGSRTVDLMGLSIRLAGFEMRDGIGSGIYAWLQGAGFPKGVNVGKATGSPEWQGWNTSLKPAWEPIILVRKPLAGTVAATVLAHGAGALNIGATRVESGDKLVRASILRTDNEVLGKGLGAGTQDEPGGRWPTNVVLAHHPDCVEVAPHEVRTGTAVNRNRGGVRKPSTVGYTSSHVDPTDVGYATNGRETIPAFDCHPDCQVAALDEQSGWQRDSVCGPGAGGFGGGMFGDGEADRTGRAGFGGNGSGGGASRFFPTFRYQAKAPKSERPIVDGQGWPTVKPLGLMRWLVRLLVPEEACVLDPFAGSGATLEAARLEGRPATGIERDDHAIALIHERFRTSTPPAPADDAPVGEAVELTLFG